MQTERIVEVRELRKRYGKENGTEALRGISFDVLAGEFLGIMEPSGSGKPPCSTAWPQWPPQPAGKSR